MGPHRVSELFQPTYEVFSKQNEEGTSYCVAALQVTLSSDLSGAWGKAYKFPHYFNFSGLLWPSVSFFLYSFVLFRSALLLLHFLAFLTSTSFSHQKSLSAVDRGQGRSKEEEKRRIRPGSIYHGKTKGRRDSLQCWLKTTDWSREQNRQEIGCGSLTSVYGSQVTFKGSAVAF